MKSAIYIENGMVQLVLTSENEWEQANLRAFEERPNKIGEVGEGTPVEAVIFRGQFYDCRGGWVRQREHYPNSNNNTEARSLIIRVKSPPPPMPIDYAPPAQYARARTLAHIGTTTIKEDDSFVYIAQGGQFIAYHKRCGQISAPCETGDTVIEVTANDPKYDDAAALVQKIVNLPEFQERVRQGVSEEIVRQLIHNQAPSEGMPDMRPNWTTYQKREGDGE